MTSAVSRARSEDDVQDAISECVQDNLPFDEDFLRACVAWSEKTEYTYHIRLSSSFKKTINQFLACLSGDLPLSRCFDQCNSCDEEKGRTGSVLGKRPPHDRSLSTTNVREDEEALEKRRHRFETTERKE